MDHSSLMPWVYSPLHILLVRGLLTRRLSDVHSVHSATLTKPVATVAGTGENAAGRLVVRSPAAIVPRATGAQDWHTLPNGPNRDASGKDTHCAQPFPGWRRRA